MLWVVFALIPQILLSMQLVLIIFSHCLFIFLLRHGAMSGDKEIMEVMPSKQKSI
jgi:hypothetical protein